MTLSETAKDEARLTESDHFPFDLCPLDYLGVATLVGADAAAFLHNQVSNDIEGLAVNGYALAAYCNPKGRVIATLRVIRTGETEFALLMSRDLVEVVVKRLRMFILRAKAVIEAVPSARVYGLPAAGSVAAIATDVPPAGRAVACGGGLLVNAGVTSDRFLFLGFGGEPPTGLLPDGTEKAWLGIMANDALPEVFAVTSETFLPQALNMDRVGGVNFRKGCYPGQEIVARLRYLGKLKQRMVRVRFGGELPRPGAAVFCADSKIGQVVLAGDIDGSKLGLVSVNFAQLNEAPLMLEGNLSLAACAPDYEVPELGSLATRF